MNKRTLSDNEEEITTIDLIPQEMQYINNVEICINIQDITRNTIEKHANREVLEAQCDMTALPTNTVLDPQSMVTNPFT